MNKVWGLSKPVILSLDNIQFHGTNVLRKIIRLVTPYFQLYFSGSNTTQCAFLVCYYKALVLQRTSIFNHKFVLGRLNSIMDWWNDLQWDINLSCSIITNGWVENRKSEDVVGETGFCKHGLICPVQSITFIPLMEFLMCVFLVQHDLKHVNLWLMVVKVFLWFHYNFNYNFK